MTSGRRWKRVKKLFAEAAALPEHEQAAFLDRACAGDLELREEVASLLAADGDGDGDRDSLPGARSAIAAVAAQAFGAPSGTVERDAQLQRVLETALGHQYEIVQPLGRGGMGAVYLARERALERFVAIKVLRPDLADAQDIRERFRREARIAAQLSHPGILPLHTFGEVSGLWYFVMGYVRGSTLAERLRVEGRIRGAEAHRILSELADALECAHRGGIIHRDIKPSNVLLDGDSGRAVLADFGIAKIAGGGDTLTATGVVMGTPHFMSPEQVAGTADVDERSDIYSLGAVGYMMLAGREPFSGVAPEALLHRRVVHDPPPLQTQVPAADVPLADVITRCLARDPGKRFASARELRDALARVGGIRHGAQPESVRELPVFGPYALLWATIWTALALSPFRPAGDRAVLLFVALLVPAGLALHIWNLASGELSPRQLARVSFWPPEWWGMWWPRALRRPTDLFGRLPGPARRVRGVLSAFIVTLPAMILIREWIEAATGGPLFGEARTRFLIAQVAVIAATALYVASTLRWARSRALSWPETVRLLFGSTSPSAGWSTPRLSRMLAMDSGTVRPPEPDSAADHLRAIIDLVASLPAAASTLGADTEAAARRVMSAIDACDREIASLSRDASTPELDRLAAQLTALEAAPDDSAERHELTDLVRQQMEVVHRMRLRCEFVTQRRTRLFNLLRGLWTRLGLAREAVAEAGAVAAGVGDHVRALVAEVEREVGTTERQPRA